MRLFFVFIDKRFGDKNELIFGKFFFLGNDGLKDYLVKFFDFSWKKFWFLYDRLFGFFVVLENYFDRYLLDNFSWFCVNFFKLC